MRLRERFMLTHSDSRALLEQALMEGDTKMGRAYAVKAFQVILVNAGSAVEADEEIDGAVLRALLDAAIHLEKILRVHCQARRVRG